MRGDAVSLQGPQQWGSDATVGDIVRPVPHCSGTAEGGWRGGCEGAEHPQTHRSAESAPRGVPVTPRPFPNPIVTARRRAALSHCPEGEGGGGGGKLRHGAPELTAMGRLRLPPHPHSPPLHPRSAPAALCGLRRSISAIPGTQRQLQPGRQSFPWRGRRPGKPHTNPPGSHCREGGGGGGGGRPHSGKGGGGAGPNPPGAEP